MLATLTARHPKLTKVAARAVRFVFSGGTAFAVDAGTLELLTRYAHVPALLARVLSIGIAMVAAWQLHRHITFQTTRRATLKEFRDYAGVALGAAVLNYAVFGVLVTGLGLANFPAVVVASAVAMLASYLGFHFHVFKHR